MSTEPTDADYKAAGRVLVSELQRELEKLRTDTARLAALIPNPIVRVLVDAVIARLIYILSQLIMEKKENA